MEGTNAEIRKVSLTMNRQKDIIPIQGKLVVRDLEGRELPCPQAEKERTWSIPYLSVKQPKVKKV